MTESAVSWILITQSSCPGLSCLTWVSVLSRESKLRVGENIKPAGVVSCREGDGMNLWDGGEERGVVVGERDAEKGEHRLSRVVELRTN